MRVQILISFQTFLLFTTPHFQTFDALKSTSFQAFQIISDFFSQMLSHPTVTTEKKSWKFSRKQKREFQGKEHFDTREKKSKIPTKIKGTLTLKTKFSNVILLDTCMLIQYNVI